MSFSLVAARGTEAGWRLKLLKLKDVVGTQDRKPWAPPERRHTNTSTKSQQVMTL